jgi:hypothetical protein
MRFRLNQGLWVQIRTFFGLIWPLKEASVKRVKVIVWALVHPDPRQCGWLSNHHTTLVRVMEQEYQWGVVFCPHIYHPSIHPSIHRARGIRAFTTLPTVLPHALRFPSLCTKRRNHDDQQHVSSLHHLDVCCCCSHQL